ncbi:MAG TPA: hypothetical protein VE152_11510, partial [Acidimicrobiales bacterium]|nr:hypothetical protein [Acidimicrobiales bacterium]
MTPPPSSPGVVLGRRRRPPAALGGTARAVAGTLLRWAGAVPLPVWCGVGLVGVVALVVAGQGLTWPAMAAPGTPHPWWFALPRA